MTERRSNGGALIFLVTLIAGLYFTRDTIVNQPAPAFSLPETYGGRVDLESFRGQPVLLVFWAASCGICRRELPLVSEMAPEFRNNHLAVVAIHLGGVEEARDYVRSNHIAVTSLVDEDGAIGTAYHVSGIPKLVLIGADGKIRRTTAGMADESTLRDWIDLVSTRQQ
jgi:peroxiredoxin